MMKRMFLASLFAEVADLFAKFELDLKGKSVCFIPTANNVDKVTFHITDAKKAFEDFGVKVDELDLAVASEKEVEEKLRKNDFIYVAGGNTFFLSQEMKRTGADKIIIEEVEKGKLYIGESAGAMITSKSIEYVNEMDPIRKAPELKDFDGLNLVDFCTVPHYKNEPFVEATYNMIKNYGDKLKLAIINNSQAIIVEGEKFEIVKSEKA